MAFYNMSKLYQLFEFILNILFETKGYVPTIKELNCYKIKSTTLQTNFIHAQYVYEGLVKNLIVALKQKKNVTAIVQCTHIFYEMILNITSKDNNTDTVLYIVPVPSIYKRYAERGYKHMLQVAHKVTDLCNSNYYRSHVADILTNTGNTTQKQAGSREHRFENAKNNLRLRKIPNTNQESIWIVIDDVTTTGATLIQAQQLLLDAGVKQVYCLAIAHKVLT